MSQLFRFENILQIKIAEKLNWKVKAAKTGTHGNEVKTSFFS